MDTDHVRRTGDIVRQSGIIPPRSDPRLDAQGGHRESHVRSSASMSPYDIHESSESMFSDERSIFNAMVSTSVEEARSGESAPGNPIVDQGLAANMAMFIPAGCQDSSATECSCGRVHGHTSQAKWWRTHMLSDQYSHSRQPGIGAVNEAADKASRTQHRKAISVGTTEKDLQRVKWPENLGSAVKRVSPRYPAPVRPPTPPGLPSFGSPEAVYCSAQFRVQNGLDANLNPDGRGIPADTHRVGSYGDAIRRFFGLTPTPPPRLSPVPVSGIGRAEDGTVVQGRFPYRQSAHGMNLARQLHDHPFHRGNLPLAHATADGGDEADTEARCMKDSSSRPRRQAPTPAPRPFRGQFQPAPSSLPCAPEPAVTTRPRKPSKTAVAALLNLPRHLSRVMPSAEVMEVPVRDMEDQSSSQVQHQSPVTDDSGDNQDSSTIAPVSLDPLSWFAAQMYLCCCMGTLDNHENHDESLVGSNDTYATARSQLS